MERVEDPWKLVVGIIRVLWFTLLMRAMNENPTTPVPVKDGQFGVKFPRETEMLFSLQPYRVPVQSVHSSQWACAGWREESTWQFVCQSPALKCFSWRRGEGGTRHLLTGPCREGTRAVFKGMKFQACDAWGSGTAVVTRQYHLLPLDFCLVIPCPAPSISTVSQEKCPSRLLFFLLS